MADIKHKLTDLQGKIIAIDGPAGAGKSTTAKLLAERLGFFYLDTGAMYRALTYHALKNGISPSDGEKLAAAARKLHIGFENRDGLNRILVNGVNVSKQIRTPEVTAHVSEVSAHRKVREAIVAKQRELGKHGSLVAEGRDTTTVVFPGADVKIYLEASIAERARRRLLDLAKMGVSTSLGEQEAEIRRRDEYDSERTHSPLTKAGDAFLVNTTQLTIEQQVDRIISLILSVLERS
jgi:cytidylate kinase